MANKGMEDSVEISTIYGSSQNLTHHSRATLTINRDKRSGRPARAVWWHGEAQSTLRALVEELEKRK